MNRKELNRAFARMLIGVLLSSEIFGMDAFSTWASTTDTEYYSEVESEDNSKDDFNEDAYRIDHTILDEWNNGYRAQITITNETCDPFFVIFNRTD